MNILVVGGGVFVGKALVDAALARNHSVSVFNRGLSRTDVPEGVEWLKGDRNADLSILGARTWDAVIDTCAYVPRHVTSLLAALKGNGGQYVFVSSISAYADHSQPNLNEAAPLAASVEPDTEAVTAKTYGPLKAMCERAVAAAGLPSALIIRPGIIHGPFDPTGRFPYWVGRVARGGEVLAPGDPKAALQLIDVRDLGAWMIRLIERKVGGAFNAVGPASPMTFGGMLEACARELNPAAAFTWVSDAFLDAQQVATGAFVPLYLPPSAGHVSKLFEVDGRAAFAAGLQLRPLAETIRDTAAWLPGAEEPKNGPIGLPAAREAELLALWHASARS